MAPPPRVLALPRGRARPALAVPRQPHWRWVIKVTGAACTLFAGEMYQLQVNFPQHYPMEAPQVIFLNPASMHSHIYSNGHICLACRHGAHAAAVESWIVAARFGCRLPPSLLLTTTLAASSAGCWREGCRGRGRVSKRERERHGIWGEEWRLGLDCEKTEGDGGTVLGSWGQAGLA